MQDEWKDTGNGSDQLNILIADGLYYRYPWIISSFVTLFINYIDEALEEAPDGIMNLSNFVKYGLDNPTACLARSMGIKNRETANLLAEMSGHLRGKAFIKWLSDITIEDLEGKDINTFDINNIMSVAIKLTPSRYKEGGNAYSFQIKGIPFELKRILLSNTIDLGMVLDYEREEDNAFDPFAIKVLYKGRELGYVPREVARKISVDTDLNIRQFKIVVDSTKRRRGYKEISVTMSTV
jgi:hypothetical protein